MIFDGRKFRDEILDSLRLRIEALSFVPEFADIVVGDDPASLQYVRMKGKTAEKIGIRSLDAHMPDVSTTEDVIEKIKTLSSRPNISGLIVQLPLPKHINVSKVLNALPLKIDVDVLSAEHEKMFFDSQSFEQVLVMPTALAIFKIVKSIYPNLKGKNVVVVGQGKLVGLPVSHLFRSTGCNFGIVDKNTKKEDRINLLQNADVIVSAVGIPNLIHGNGLKNGVVFVDAGTSEDGGTIVGDAHFESVSEIASFITPTPGGVGPVTIACLMNNVCTVAEIKQKEKSYA